MIFSIIVVFSTKLTYLMTVILLFIIFIKKFRRILEALFFLVSGLQDCILIDVLSILIYEWVCMCKVSQPRLAPSGQAIWLKSSEFKGSKTGTIGFLLLTGIVLFNSKPIYQITFSFFLPSLRFCFVIHWAETAGSKYYNLILIYGVYT